MGGMGGEMTDMEGEEGVEGMEEMMMVMMMMVMGVRCILIVVSSVSLFFNVHRHLRPSGGTGAICRVTPFGVLSVWRRGTGGALYR